MDRKEFLKKFAVLGLASPFMASFLNSCSKENIQLYNNLETNFDGKVLIIGAGAAGLMAGYILQKQNIDFQIIEAASDFGGRVKKTDDFADFPIDLGAEWIHTNPSIFASLLSDPNQEGTIESIVYNPQTIYVWRDGKLRRRNIYSNFYSEHKFKRSTWYDFFADFIVPKIQEKIVYNSPITEIDYLSDKVIATSSNNEIFEGDKILVTVPLTILQKNLISFSPALPPTKMEAINSVDMPDGIKIFAEFSERFYPDIILYGGLGSYLNGDGDKIFYDAAFKKDSNRNILGLFSVGTPSSAYTSLDTEEEIIQLFLTELDEMFDGRASQTYQKHVIQNWSKEPFIQGSYSYDYNNNRDQTITTLLEPLENKVYFAGEALNYGDSSTVHGAAETAYSVLETMLQQ